jgi:ATP-dependent Lhr-like helicase
MTVDRKLLPRTFGPWFGRFSALTEVQLASIPLVMGGRDVLICSPTASGKTEAYAAPCAEMAARHRQELPTALIVAPTRALANDLKRRLAGPMSLADVSFGRYTGEHKERVAGKLPSVLVTTPEALDSLLARRASMLTGVRMVVLDEIHVLDNTPRGDQLRVLLHRLELAAASRPQRIAASATVDRPQELGARYLSDFEVVVVRGFKGISAKAFDGNSPAAMAEHLHELARHGFRKILVFCRSRNQVETYATKLFDATNFSKDVYAHHGSLAMRVRERNERLFHSAPAAVCFATLTLEMGIDIGSVDYVLLAGLPSDVASLLQRIGRGGRRDDVTRAGYVVGHPAERFLFESMFGLGKQGRLCARPYGFRPSVIVQQALVLACSGTYLELDDLRRAIGPEVRRELGEKACTEILDSLVAAELLERRGPGRFVVTESIEKRFELGTLHSNIDDAPGIEIVDRLTGDILGKVEGAESSHIEVAGRDRRVAKRSEGRILTDAGRGSEPARFKITSSPSVSLRMGRAIVESLGVPVDAVGVLRSGGSTIWLHGLGSVGSLLLTHLMGRTAGRRAVASTSPYTLEVRARVDRIPSAGADAVDRFVKKYLKSLTQLVSPGPWDHAVPEHLRSACTRRIAGVDEIATFLARARLHELPGPDEELTAVLVDL